MTVAAEGVGSHAPEHTSASPAIPVPDRPWLAAVAIVPILATVYQTLVLTDVTDDVIRKGIEAEHYSMIWTNVCWGVATLYGVFAGIWAMARFGAPGHPPGRPRLVRAGQPAVRGGDRRHHSGGGQAGGGHRQGDGDRYLPRGSLPSVRPHGDRGHRLLRRDRLCDPAPTTPLLTALVNDGAVVALDILCERAVGPPGSSAGAPLR